MIFEQRAIDLDIGQAKTITITPTPETNMAPENNPLEKEIPIGNRPFSGAMLNFREGNHRNREPKHILS